MYYHTIINTSLTHLLHKADYSRKVALQSCILEYKPANLLGQDRL